MTMRYHLRQLVRYTHMSDKALNQLVDSIELRAWEDACNEHQRLKNAQGADGKIRRHITYHQLVIKRMRSNNPDRFAAAIAHHEKRLLDTIEEALR